jgi:aerobic carbon-monoxide dehydrogenase small subunit
MDDGTAAATEEIVRFTVNRERAVCVVEPRTTLLDCLRDQLHLHGTHVGCEHGVCGACNVHVDGQLVRSCLMLAVQADGAAVTTIEGIEGPDNTLSAVQEAFCTHHAMQCGYCTPGMVMALEDLFARTPTANDDEITEAISGNICRCTGYQQIRDAARQVSQQNAMAAAAQQDGE